MEVASREYRLVSETAKKARKALKEISGKRYEVESKEEEAIAELRQDVAKDIAILTLVSESLSIALFRYKEVVSRMEFGEAKREEVSKFKEMEEECMNQQELIEDLIVTLVVTEKNLRLAMESSSQEKRRRKKDQDQRARKLKRNEPAACQPASGGEERRSLSPHRPRLPRHVLPTFDGTGDWSAFWRLFDAIVGSQRIAAVEKVVYLLGALRGEALDLVRGYDVSDSAYPWIVKTLEEEYGTREMQLLRLHNELFALPQAKESTASLHRTVCDLQRILKSMTTLGESVNHSFMETVVQRKLPPSLLESTLREKNRRKEKFSVEDQLEFLSKEVAIRRRVEEINGGIGDVSNLSTGFPVEKPKLKKSKKESAFFASAVTATPDRQATPTTVVYPVSTTVSYAYRAPKAHIPSTTVTLVNTSSTSVSLSLLVPASTTVSIVNSAPVLQSSESTTVVYDVSTTVSLSLVCPAATVPQVHSTPAAPTFSVKKPQICAGQSVSTSQQSVFFAAWRVLVWSFVIRTVMDGHTRREEDQIGFDSRWNSLSLVGHLYDDPGGWERLGSSRPDCSPVIEWFDDPRSPTPLPDYAMPVACAVFPSFELMIGSRNRWIDPG